jgi:hypothetical protein
MRGQRAINLMLVEDFVYRDFEWIEFGTCPSSLAVNPPAKGEMG